MLLNKAKGINAKVSRHKNQPIKTCFQPEFTGSLAKKQQSTKRGLTGIKVGMLS